MSLSADDRKAILGLEQRYCDLADSGDVGGLVEYWMKQTDGWA